MIKTRTIINNGAQLFRFLKDHVTLYFWSNKCSLIGERKRLLIKTKWTNLTKPKLLNSSVHVQCDIEEKMNSCTAKVKEKHLLWWSFLKKNKCTRLIIKNQWWKTKSIIYYIKRTYREPVTM